MQWQLPVSRTKSDSSLNVLVTGSRGKSSIVRLLHSALQGMGLKSYARITGVVPRELSPTGIRAISRSSGAHVGEMHWWLNQLPSSRQAIVLENSAISPDFQDLAGRWLKPDVTVLSNTNPDHQEAWGQTRNCAADVLVKGIPMDGKVILPSSLKADQYLQDLLGHRDCQVVFAEPVARIRESFRAVNLGLALTTIRELGLASKPAMQAMLELPTDDYDFKIIDCGGAELAMAFSVNDISSTKKLFDTLRWSEHETRLIYNHRRDRPERFKSFIEWLNLPTWKEVLIIGDRPPMRHCLARHLRIKNRRELSQLFRPGERIFGCGNIAGLPMSLAIGQVQQSD